MSSADDTSYIQYALHFPNGDVQPLESIQAAQTAVEHATKMTREAQRFAPGARVVAVQRTVNVIHEPWTPVTP